MKQELIWGLGRRKTSVARVRLVSGKGKISELVCLKNWRIGITISGDERRYTQSNFD